ncbi:MAG: serine/threonine protein phosphatase [Desulfovibrionales bacterium]|nr:MAG: serine/threonine protein phosphatase [Desulfovibrionales bacterium]
MFAFLKKITTRARPSSSRVPEGVRVYAVGDVHGRADLLQRLHLRMTEDARSSPMEENVVVYLGDYVDRGLQVREVLDTLLTGLPEGFQAVYLRGNHEEMMLRFLEDPQHLEAWMSIGAQATLMNYRVGVNGNGSTGKRAAEFREALRDAMPDDHLYFLRLLQTSFTLGDYYFVHAGVRPGRPLGSQKTEDLLWIRDDFLSSTSDFGARIVHGHSIVDQPEVRPNRISLDTGAYATGVLSCAVLEADQVRFL